MKIWINLIMTVTPRDKRYKFPSASINAQSLQTISKLRQSKRENQGQTIKNKCQ